MMLGMPRPIIEKPIGLNVDDVFAASLYTGDGATQAIANGVDLVGNSGLVWIKNRTNPAGFGTNALRHSLVDTVRGKTSRLSSDMAAPTDTGENFLSSFNTNGFTVGPNTTIGYNNVNTNAYVSWTFQKAPRFFDIVTYTGDGAGQRAVPHSMENAPGLVITKRLDGTQDWQVVHNSGYGFKLNTGAAQGITGAQTGNASTFNVGRQTGWESNTAGAAYIAYLFAHDPKGVVQCLSFTTDASGNASLNHGWAEGVQFAMLKCTTATGNWEMFDTARSPGWATDRRLLANTNGGEDIVTRISGTGTTLSFTGLSASQTYVAMLIRAPA